MCLFAKIWPMTLFGLVNANVIECGCGEKIKETKIKIQTNYWNKSVTILSFVFKFKRRTHRSLRVFESEYSH
jgi:hypothetical protein